MKHASTIALSLLAASTISASGFQDAKDILQGVGKPEKPEMPAMLDVWEKTPTRC